MSCFTPMHEVAFCRNRTLAHRYLASEPPPFDLQPSPILPRQLQQREAHGRWKVKITVMEMAGQSCSLSAEYSDNVQAALNTKGVRWARPRGWGGLTKTRLRNGWKNPPWVPIRVLFCSQPPLNLLSFLWLKHYHFFLCPERSV